MKTEFELVFVCTLVQSLLSFFHFSPGFVMILTNHSLYPDAPSIQTEEEEEEEGGGEEVRRKRKRGKRRRSKRRTGITYYSGGLPTQLKTNLMN